MRKTVRFSLLLATGLIVALALPGLAQEQASTAKPKTEYTGRPRLAVMPVENTFAAEYRTNVGNALADIFISELMKTGRFVVLERSELESLIGEIDLGEAGYVEEETRVPKGFFKGVDYAFFAKLTDFGVESRSVGGGGIIGGALGGLGVKKQKARARIDFRLVEVRTGKTILTGTGEGQFNRTGLTAIGANFGSWIAGIDIRSNEFRESEVGKAIMKAVGQIIDQIKQKFPLRARVVAVSGTTVYLDLGENAGLKPGMVGKLLELTVIRDEDGTVVFEEKKEVGRVEILEVQANGSKGRVKGLAPFYELKPGTVVEFEEEEEEK